MEIDLRTLYVCYSLLTNPLHNMQFLYCFVYVNVIVNNTNTYTSSSYTKHCFTTTWNETESLLNALLLTLYQFNIAHTVVPNTRHSHMFYTCSTHVLHMPYTCLTHIPLILTLYPDRGNIDYISSQSVPVSSQVRQQSRLHQVPNVMLVLVEHQDKCKMRSKSEKYQQIVLPLKFQDHQIISCQNWTTSTWITAPWPSRVTVNTGLTT